MSFQGCMNPTEAPDGRPGRCAAGLLTDGSASFGAFPPIVGQWPDTPIRRTPQLQWWARAGITPASITLGSPFSPLPGVTGQQSTARYSVCTAHNWGSRRQLSTQRPRALHSPNPSREMPGASLFPIPLGEELSDPLPSWTLRNSSGVSKGIDKSVVQSGRDFPYIRVGGGQ